MIANGARGEVGVSFNGETRVIRFTMDALGRLQTVLGVSNFGEVMSAARPGDATNPAFAKFLWAGLTYSMPELTLEEVEAGEYPAAGALLAVGQAFYAAIGTPPGIEGDADPLGIVAGEESQAGRNSE
jgi:hypothetical protein